MGKWFMMKILVNGYLWGYKGKNKLIDDQWLVEVDDKVKNTEDELIDPRTLKRAERKKLIKKNELQHKRNLRNQGAV